MVVTLVKALHTASTTSHLNFAESRAYHKPKAEFVSRNPTYSNSRLSALRRREYSRLDSNGASVYLDYTGASLYAQSLIESHTRWLKQTVAGNPHSTSPVSLASSAATKEARKAVLEFFDADHDEYHVVWTANATGGFRIVGETYDFTPKRVLIPRDAHNSLNSLAKRAQNGGGVFEMIEFDSVAAKEQLPDAELDIISNASYLAKLQGERQGLVFFTRQSNITGAKLDMELLQIAKTMRWDVGLDAAALAPSTRISLRQNKRVDMMVVSLYKIMAYPTGLGALILRKSMYQKLTSKTTFFRGNIVGITMDKFEFTLVEGPERFEDGTANFASMPAVMPGLQFAAKWMPHYSARNKILMKWLIDELEAIYYPCHAIGGSASSTDGVSEKPISANSQSGSLTATADDAVTMRGVKLVKIGGPTTLDKRGATLLLVFSSSLGESLNYNFVIWAAGQENISLRGGPCMCNPGASSSVMQRGMITDLEASSLLRLADVGLVRISLGPPTNFKDVWRLVHFCRKLSDPKWTEHMWNKYAKMMGTNAGTLSNNIDELQAWATRQRDNDDHHHQQ